MIASEVIEHVLTELDLKAPTFAKKIGVGQQRIHDIQTGHVTAGPASPGIRQASRSQILTFAWGTYRMNIRWLTSTLTSITAFATEQTEKFWIY